MYAVPRGGSRSHVRARARTGPGVRRMLCVRIGDEVVCMAPAYQSLYQVALAMGAPQYPKVPLK